MTVNAVILDAALLVIPMRGGRVGGRGKIVPW